MKALQMAAVFVVVLSGITPSFVHAATAFSLDKGALLLVAKNHDYHLEKCYLFANQRNLKKTAMVRSVDPEGSVGIPGSWTSRYGSITFNQFGREFPSGGMNEAGLVVETTEHLVGNNKFPEPDSRPSIFCGQWVQYALDNFKTVSEVIESDAEVRIRQKPNKGALAPHFLVCDQSGDCAVIEFIDGKRFVYRGKSLPVKVLSTSEYETSLQSRKQNTLPVPEKYGSVKNFIKVADMIEKFDPQGSVTGVNYAFKILESVGRDAFIEVNGEKIRDFYSTVWSAVYDLNSRRIYFCTNTNRKTRYLDLKPMQFSCRKPLRVLDIHAAFADDISGNFIDYTPQLNRTLLSDFISGMEPFSWSFDRTEIEKEKIEEAVTYPESFTCIEQ